jgi:uncharacterized phage-like protein YoqJ
LDERLKATFKRDLIKIAKETNAWIITAGLNCGVMRLVGDAVIEGLHKGPVIGITKWQSVIDHEKLQGQNIKYV